MWNGLIFSVQQKFNVFLIVKGKKMKIKAMAILAGSLLASTAAIADGLAQSVSLSATTQLSAVSASPNSVVTATAPLTAQTATVDPVTGNPLVSVFTDVAPTVAVTGIGSATVTVIQSAAASSSIPVIPAGSSLASIPSL